MTQPNIDQILRHAQQYASQYPQSLSAKPSKEMAVVMCMDARLRAYSILGISEGEAHIMRNAGGVVTDDVMRSLIISQRLLGTRHIILVHHTGCGMTTFTDDEMRAELERETGMRPSFALESFSDPDADVRQSIKRIQNDPFILHKDSIIGFVFDIENGQLRVVE